MGLTELEQATLKTICYFDVIGYPLSLLEIRKTLTVKTKMSELLPVIGKLEAAGLVASKQGLYFLVGRDNLVESRLIGYRHSIGKLRQLNRHLRWLKLLPFVRAIAVFSSLSLQNSQKNSDIDLFIITAHDRLWTARLFVALALKLLRLRPTAQSRSDKLCASYFADEYQADLSLINGEQDFFRYYYGAPSFVFFFSQASAAKNFYAQNRRLTEQFPQWHMTAQIKAVGLSASALKLKILLEKIFSRLPEKKLMDFQLKKLPAKLQVGRASGGVITTSCLAKLHDNNNNQSLFRSFASLYEDQLLRADQPEHIN